MKSYQKKYFNLIQDVIRATKKTDLGGISDDETRELRIVAACAHGLYLDLTQDGHAISFDPAIREAREVPPTDSEFFSQYHALENFVSLCENL